MWPLFWNLHNYVGIWFLAYKDSSADLEIIYASTNYRNDFKLGGNSEYNVCYKSELLKIYQNLAYI